MPIAEEELSQLIGVAVAEADAREKAYMLKRARKEREEETRRRWVEEFLIKAERVFDNKGIHHEDGMIITNIGEWPNEWHETLPYPVLYGDTNLAVKLQGDIDPRIHSRSIIGRVRIIALTDDWDRILTIPKEITLLTIDNSASQIRNWLGETANEGQKVMAMRIVDALSDGLQIPKQRHIQHDQVQ